MQFLGGGSTSKFLIFLSLSYLKNLGFADSGTSHQMVQWPRRSPRTLVFLSSIQLTKGFLRFYRVLEYQLLVVVVDLPCCSTPLRARLSWPFVLTRQNQNKRSMVTSHHRIWKSRQQLLPTIKKWRAFTGYFPPLKLLPTINVTSHQLRKKFLRGRRRKNGRNKSGDWISRKLPLSVRSCMGWVPCIHWVKFEKPLLV